MDQNKMYTLELQGKGKTKEESFLNAISSIQKNITKQTGETILRIEPVDVKIIDAVETKYTEKFLFLFFKRELSHFNIKMEVQVRVFSLDLEKIEFKTVRKALGFFG